MLHGTYRVCICEWKGPDGMLLKGWTSTLVLLTVKMFFVGRSAVTRLGWQSSAIASFQYCRFQAHEVGVDSWFAERLAYLLCEWVMAEDCMAGTRVKTSEKRKRKESNVNACAPMKYLIF